MEELQRWLVNPQACWLQQLGLHTGEGIEAVLDFEDLELDALQRHQLLERAIEAQLPSGDVPRWRHDLAGQGVLPAGAGAELEEWGLLQRWQAIQQVLDPLGPCRRDGSRLFAGEVHVVVQPGRLSAHGVMRAWLHHLQLCADAVCFAGSAVVARAERGDGATRHLTWTVLEPDKARSNLSQVQQLAQQGLSQCWPVPPNSGWALMWHEWRKPGSGVDRFRRVWELEREKVPQQLCFGRGADAALLLNSDGFASACEALYRPLLAALVP